MKILKDDLLKIDSFQEEKEKFYVISLISTGDNPLIISDLDNYVIARSEIGYPTWIWTKDNISKDIILELEKELDNYFVSGENKFTCKKELFELLKKKNDTYKELEMGFLSCDEPVKPSKGKGIFVRPNYSDKVTIAEYLRAHNKELFNKETTQKDALEEVEGWLEENNFYVLKDSSGEIVSMASFGIVGNLAKISHVYTTPEERGKGYCQYLIYSLAKKLIDDGYKPILYTDYDYKASNEAYKKVGFQDNGTLMNFSIDK